MRKIAIALIVVLVLAVAIFMVVRHTRSQILDGPGMVRNPDDYPAKETADSMSDQGTVFQEKTDSEG